MPSSDEERAAARAQLAEQERALRAVGARPFVTRLSDAQEERIRVIVREEIASWEARTAAAVAEAVGRSLRLSCPEG